jgi:hypothetical protein
LWKFVSSFWFLISYCQLMYLLIHVDSRGFWSRHWCKASKMVKHRCRWTSEQKCCQSCSVIVDNISMED